VPDWANCAPYGLEAEHQLSVWSQMHGLPIEQLKRSTQLPAFVMVRVGQVLLSYPTGLVFLPITTTTSTVKHDPMPTPVPISTSTTAITLTPTKRNTTRDDTWSYVDHRHHLTMTVLAQCAMHEPTPAAEESQDSEWHPVIISTHQTDGSVSQNDILEDTTLDAEQEQQIARELEELLCLT
jgi:hypothetical protein